MEAEAGELLAQESEVKCHAPGCGNAATLVPNVTVYVVLHDGTMRKMLLMMHDTVMGNACALCAGHAKVATLEWLGFENYWPALEVKLHNVQAQPLRESASLRFIPVE